MTGKMKCPMRWQHAVLSLWICTSAFGDLAADRPFLLKLDEKPQVKKTDFDYPFLLAETARAFPDAAPKMTEKLIAFLKQDALPYRGHFSKEGLVSGKIDAKHLALPEIVTSGKQLEGIRKCSLDYCLMKLSRAEKKTLEGATDKVTTFREVVATRVRGFIERNELMGYEERKADKETVKKMFPLLPFLKLRYPLSLGYINGGFWEGKTPPAGFKGSFFRQELVNISHDKLQPIWRIGEVLHFQEKDTDVFYEIFPYSNHYLDSSFRVYEVMPREKGSTVILTDVMEIDELTKSGIIRVLYKGTMQDAVSHVQAEELESM